MPTAVLKHFSHRPTVAQVRLPAVNPPWTTVRVLAFTSDTDSHPLLLELLRRLCLILVQTLIGVLTVYHTSRNSIRWLYCTCSGKKKKSTFDYCQSVLICHFFSLLNRCHGYVTSHYHLKLKAQKPVIQNRAIKNSQVKNWPTLNYYSVTLTCQVTWWRHLRCTFGTTPLRTLKCLFMDSSSCRSKWGQMSMCRPVALCRDTGSLGCYTTGRREVSRRLRLTRLTSGKTCNTLTQMPYIDCSVHYLHNTYLLVTVEWWTAAWSSGSSWEPWKTISSNTLLKLIVWTCYVCEIEHRLQ